MDLRKLGNKFFMSIPHLSLLFDMRRNQRYVLHEGIRVEIAINDTPVKAKLFDIGFGGIRLASIDDKIEDAKIISVSAEGFRVDLPCKTVWKDEHCYGIEFKSMNRREMAHFKYFIENFMKEVQDNEVAAMLR
jgi:hypothetical protein